MQSLIVYLVLFHIVKAQIFFIVAILKGGTQCDCFNSWLAKLLHEWDQRTMGIQELIWIPLESKHLKLSHRLIC